MIIHYNRRHEINAKRDTESLELMFELFRTQYVQSQSSRFRPAHPAEDSTKREDLADVLLAVVRR